MKRALVVQLHRFIGELFDLLPDDLVMKLAVNVMLTARQMQEDDSRTRTTEVDSLLAGINDTLARLQQNAQREAGG